VAVAVTARDLPRPRDLAMFAYANHACLFTRIACAGETLTIEEIMQLLDEIIEEDGYASIATWLEFTREKILLRLPQAKER